jgi:hypothetical protein
MAIVTRSSGMPFSVAKRGETRGASDCMGTPGNLAPRC